MSRSDPSDAESHRNEGFLKSIWHNITNHPAHRSSNAPTDAQKNTAPESGKPENKKEPKKASDSGSA